MKKHTPARAVESPFLVAGERGNLLVRGTTILSVRHQGKVVMAGDGQVTVGTTVVKHNAVKVKKIYKDQVLAGFAGAAADAMALAAPRTNSRPLSRSGASRRRLAPRRPQWGH